MHVEPAVPFELEAGMCDAAAVLYVPSWLVGGQQWLEERDWSEVKNNYRVDRRTVPILSTAQDLIQGRTPDTPADQIKVAGAVRGYDEDDDEVGRARVRRRWLWRRKRRGRRSGWGRVDG